VAERRCTFKCGDWNCGSYQFNLYKADIDQGDLCDVHYWQTKAQRKWVGLTDEEVNTLWGEWKDAVCLDHKTWAQAIEAKLKERNT
jgi:hypothetical protein